MRRARKIFGLILAVVMIAMVGMVVPVGAAEAVKLDAGEGHSLALIGTTVYAWGDNSFGQLGTGDNKAAAKPVAIDVDGKEVVDISAGRNFSAAVTKDGSLYTWGDNGKGQLGLGNKTNRNKPTLVATAGYTKVSGGHDHLLVMSATGVFGAGSDTQGQLGVSAAGDQTKLVSIKTGSFKQVEAGRYMSAIIDSGNVLYTTGYNDCGQLGVGTLVASATFAQVRAGIKAVALGFAHVVAIATDDRVYAWGDNNVYAVGNPTMGFIKEPTLISGLSAISVAAGTNISGAIAKDGTLYGWGSGFYGELADGRSGNGVSTDKPLAATSNKYKLIASGTNHKLAYATDGSVYAWGYNAAGQLGDGTKVFKATPVKITFPEPTEPPKDPDPPEEPEVPVEIYTQRALNQLVKPGESVNISIIASAATQVVKVTNPSDTQVWASSKTFKEETRAIGGEDTLCHVFDLSFALEDPGTYQIRLYAGSVNEAGRNEYNNADAAIKRLTVRAFDYPIVVSLTPAKEVYTGADETIEFVLLTDTESDSVKITDIEGNTLVESTTPETTVNGFSRWRLSAKAAKMGYSFYFAYAGTDGVYDDEAITKRAMAIVSAGAVGPKVLRRTAELANLDAEIAQGTTVTYTIVAPEGTEGITMYNIYGEEIAETSTVAGIDETTGEPFFQIRYQMNTAGKHRFYLGAYGPSGNYGPYKFTPYVKVAE